MSQADAFEHDDAAYVMGLLPEPERVAFEVHLTSCADCARRVGELTSTTDALAMLTADDLLLLEEDASPQDQVPDTLLPGLLRRAGVARRRQRWVTAGVTGLAAACVIALVAVVWPAASSAHSVQPQALSALVATPLEATAAVRSTGWGTEISLDCHYYPGWSPGPTPPTYGLTVIGKDGSSHSLGTWTVSAGTHSKFTSGTALASSQLRSIEITDSKGKPVLSLAV
jgi:hypothetical protein